MHLKNFSLITRDGKVELAPAYDFLSTTIAYQSIGESLRSIEEIALPLNGKKRKLTKKDWIDYFALNRLKLKESVVSNILQSFFNAVPPWKKLIQRSFLSEKLKELYITIISERLKIFQ